MINDWRNTIEYPRQVNDFHVGLLQQPHYRGENQGLYDEQRFIGPFIVPFAGAFAGSLLAGILFRPNYYPPYPQYQPYPPYPPYQPYPFYPRY